jgi:hypothetical protein
MRRDKRLLNRRALHAGLVAAAISSACHHSSTPGPEALRGIVKSVGTARAPEVMLQRTTADNALVAVRATAEDAAALARASGTLVAVRGTFAAPDTVVVSSFQVVEVNGQPVTDGVVRQDNGRLSICPPASRCLALGNPPAQLRTLLGARVWIGGPLETGPNQFGLIKPAE